MLNYGRCVLCARCEEVCPTQAIRLCGEFELAVRTKADLMASAQFTLTRCRNCDKPFAPTKEVNYVMALLERAGMNKETLEHRRVLYETCTECRRLADFSRLQTMELVSGLDGLPAGLVANSEAQSAFVSKGEAVR
jgi:ferredoxin